MAVCRFSDVCKFIIAGSSSLLLLLTLGAVPAAVFAESDIRLTGLRAAPNVEPSSLRQRANLGEVLEEVHPAQRTLDRNPIYDKSNPDYLRLQTIHDATREMPRDPIGFTDWMAALRSGAINPRAGLSIADKMNVLDLDIVMKNTKEMPFVRFPHRSHTLWLDCTNCHPTPFQPKAGSNPVSMSRIFRGEYCGMCHDRVAFLTFFSCNRCHSVAQGVSSEKN